MKCILRSADCILSKSTFIVARKFSRNVTLCKEIARVIRGVKPGYVFQSGHGAVGLHLERGFSAAGGTTYWLC